MALWLPELPQFCSLRAEYEMPIKTSTTICGGRSEFLHESGLQFHWAARCPQGKQNRHITARHTWAWVKMEGWKNERCERERISCHYGWIDNDNIFLTLNLGRVWSRWQIRGAAAVHAVSIVEPLICPNSLALWLLLWGIYSPWWIALQRPQQSRDPSQHCTRVPLECPGVLFFFFSASFLSLNQTEQALSLDRLLLAR